VFSFSDKEEGGRPVKSFFLLFFLLGFFSFSPDAYWRKKITSVHKIKPKLRSLHFHVKLRFQKLIFIGWLRLLLPFFFETI